MRYLFYLGHPAHFHLFREVIPMLKNAGHEIKVLIKKKDVLEQLLKDSGWDYTNIMEGDRGDSKLEIAWGLLKRDYAILKIASKYKPDLMAGTSTELGQVGRLLGIPSFNINEDDAAAVPLFAKMGYPFATRILAPDCCDCGKWNYKKIPHNSYHELAYLHPNYFRPDESIMKKYGLGNKYFILRFAQLNAHHDKGRKGITPEIAERIISLLSPAGNVFITSERKLESQFEKYRISIPPLEIHNALYYATMYIGDSQTMAAEAAVLGTPSIRFNDFIGELGYLEELEHSFGLTYGIKTMHPEKLFGKISEILTMPDAKGKWADKRNHLLKEKDDFSRIMFNIFTDFRRIISEQNPVLTADFSNSDVG
jgi:predicted glycosyltransferase